MAFTSHGCGLQSSVALQLRTFDTPFCTTNHCTEFMVFVSILRPILSSCSSVKTFFWSGTAFHSTLFLYSIYRPFTQHEIFLHNFFLLPSIMNTLQKYC